MTITIELSPQAEAWVKMQALIQGSQPTDVVKKLVDRQTAPAPPTANGRDTSLALLDSWLAQVPTDPDAMREAEEDLLEFKRNMNRNRKEIGAPLIYPDIE